MADLFTGGLFSAGLAAVGIGTSIASTSEQVKSAQLTGQANSSMYLYQAQIAKQNADIAKQNAAWERITGEQQAAVKGSQDRAEIGGLVASRGASGLDLNSGSNREVVDSAHLVSSVDQNAIRSNAAQAAYAYDVQAAQAKSQARAYRSASAYALEGADVSANASVLGGVSSVASKWLQASQAGSFSGITSKVGGLFS